VLLVYSMIWPLPVSPRTAQRGAASITATLFISSYRQRSAMSRGRDDCGSLRRHFASHEQIPSAARDHYCSMIAKNVCRASPLFILVSMPSPHQHDFTAIFLKYHARFLELEIFSLRLPQSPRLEASLTLSGRLGTDF